MHHDRPRIAVAMLASDSSPRVPGRFDDRNRHLALASLLEPGLLAEATDGHHRRSRPDRWTGCGSPPPLRPQGQADHLPVHGRRAVAPGDARLQADAGPDARPADARVVHPRHADRPAPGAKARLLRSPASVSAAAVRAARRSARSSRTWPRSPTTSASSARW